MLFTDLTFLLRFLPAFLILYYPVGAIFKEKARLSYRNLILLLASLVFYTGIGPEGITPINLIYLGLLLFSILVNYLLAMIIDAHRPLYIPQHSADNRLISYSPRRTLWLILAILFNALILITFKYVPLLMSRLAASAFLQTGTLAILPAGLELWLQRIMQRPGFTSLRQFALNFAKSAAVYTSKLPLPLGISFYTFTSLSYIIDIYRGQSAEKNPLHFANFILFFPRVLQGPLSRYAAFDKDLHQRKTDYSLIEEGVELFIIGMAFQVLLSGKIASLWADVQRSGPGGIGSIVAWLGAWGYSMQLYFDFFGYSLMAVGLAKIIGFSLPRNFDSPYASTSASEFWRRWHITLGAWLRDYIYIPLGGSRQGIRRLILSLFVTWFFTAIWHGTGWNFLIWGGFFFVLILLERFVYGKLLKKVPILGHLYMLIVIPVSWMIFAIPNLGTLLAYLKKMFFIDLSSSFISSPLFGLNETLHSYWWLMLLCILFSTPYPARLFEKYKHSWLIRLLVLALFWVTLWQLITTGSNPFMYLNF